MNDSQSVKVIFEHAMMDSAIRYFQEKSEGGLADEWKLRRMQP